MMGNHDVGRAFAAVADVFWAGVPEGATPSKEVTLAALTAAGERFNSADAEFDGELSDHTTPLGQMIAIAFDATPEEISNGDLWYDGPVMRFREFFKLS